MTRFMPSLVLQFPFKCLSRTADNHHVLASPRPTRHISLATRGWLILNNHSFSEIYLLRIDFVRIEFARKNQISSFLICI